MKVSTLARALGLPKDADQATCQAKIEELKATRRRRASLDETRAAVARMQVKFGIDPPKAELERLIAQRIGPDSFLLNGKVLSGEEVEAAVMEQLAEDHEHDELRADLGPSLKDANVHTRAMRLLSERGVWEPDGPTYLRACQEVGAR